MLELVEKNWRVGRGLGVRTEAVGERLGRRERREEVSKTWRVMEREPVAGCCWWGWWSQSQLLVRLVRLEPGLTEDQLRKMFCSWKS